MKIPGILAQMGPNLPKILKLMVSCEQTTYTRPRTLACEILDSHRAGYKVGDVTTFTYNCLGAYTIANPVGQ